MTNRIAHLMHAVPLIQLRVGDHVCHQPALLESQIFHRGADRGTHEAVGAVAAEYVGAVDDVLGTGDAVGEGHSHATGIVLGDIGDFRIAAKLYA